MSDDVRINAWCLLVYLTICLVIATPQVSQCNAAFTALMNELLGHLNVGHGQESNRYANLVHRLNFNNFYTFK